MKEGKRQKQVGGLIHQELVGIFQKMGLNTINSKMVTISGVKITPDLLEARVYVSIYPSQDAEASLAIIKDKGGEIKRQLGNALAKHLRRIPEIRYFLDNTLDQAFKIEEIFKEIKKESQEGQDSETN
jgi:ribosome-binding factor A